MLANEAEHRSKVSAAQRAFRTANENLEADLRNKANAAGTGIKHNRRYGDANYDIRKLKVDIAAVKTESYVSLSQEKVDEFSALLKETAKPEIAESPDLSLQYKTIVEEARLLLGRRIAPSEPIQELLDDALLQEWVRTGREHHENKRETCGFCGSRLPKDLWTTLDKHFSQESEALRKDITSLSSMLDHELDRAGSSLLGVDVGDFYATHAQRARDLTSEIQAATAAYNKALNARQKALDARAKDIFTVGSVPTVV